MKRWWKFTRLLGRIAGISLGAGISAFGVQAFIVQARLGGGGVGGIALLLFYTLGLPVGTMTLLLNIPLLLLGWKEVNRTFVLKTLYGIAVFSILLNILKGVHPLPFEDLFLGALYGGVVGGIGSGIVFRLGGSLGGTDIVAKVLRRKFGWAMGTTMLVINMVILLASGTVLGPKIALYTLVSTFAFSRTVDVIQSGIPAKAVTIISQRSEELAQLILTDIGRGATFLSGRGAYSEQNQEVIMCVVNLSELWRLKQIVRDIDPKAFLIVQDASEVVGRGFMSMD
ncbi:MAG: YitT family protein [Desulfitobacteriaceae bacterium]